MKKILIFLCAVTLVFALAEVSDAVTLDFESTPIGEYSQLVFADLTIAPQDNNDLFQVVSMSPGYPISNHALITYYNQITATPLVATFSIADVTSFSIGVGDYNVDVDNTYLEVYDSNHNLLGSDYYQNPGSTYGGDYLGVTTITEIAYAVFWDGDPSPGAVLWDNLTYETTASAPVPEPSTILLLSTGLLGLVAFGRKRLNKKT